MNIEIIITTLSSGIIAAFASKLYDRYAANVDFKRDYYKKVIDERLKIYTQLISALSKAGSHFSFEGKPYSGVFRTAETFRSFFLEMDEVSNARIWLTNEAAIKLINLKNVITNPIPGISKMSDDDIKKVGIKLDTDLMMAKEQLEEVVLKDFIALYDVDKFFEVQKKDLETLY